MFQKAQLRQLRLKGIVSTQALLALSSTRYAPWMTKLGKNGVESTSNVEMFHEMSHPDCTWTFGLRLRSLKIKPLKLRCSTVGRLSLEDGLLVGKMRMDNGWSKLYQNSIWNFHVMYLLNTVASRFPFQLRWFSSGWLCYDTCARVIWWMIQFWSAWSNHDDVWHRWCVTCARCTLSSPLLIQVCMDLPPICEEHSVNATTLTCRYWQVHGTSDPSLFGASGSICMAPGRKTDVQNWTGWNYSELYYLQILIGYEGRSSFLIALFSTLSQHSAIAMGTVESQKIRYPSHHPTVLQRISGLIPSLWSLSVTKFPYGNVDCALEKNSIGAIGFLS